jgi:hypothetical protein
VTFLRRLLRHVLERIRPLRDGDVVIVRPGEDEKDSGELAEKEWQRSRAAWRKRKRDETGGR